MTVESDDDLRRQKTPPSRLPKVVVGNGGTGVPVCKSKNELRRRIAGTSPDFRTHCQAADHHRNFVIGGRKGAKTFVREVEPVADRENGRASVKPTCHLASLPKNWAGMPDTATGCPATRSPLDRSVTRGNSRPRSMLRSISGVGCG